MSERKFDTEFCPPNVSRECRKAFETWADANGFEVVPMMSMDAYYSGATDRALFAFKAGWDAAKLKEPPHV
jgi:hypothetical protein